MAAPPTGTEALHHLTQTEPPSFLTPSPHLSSLTRIASQHLFSSLKPYSPKTPFSHLLIHPHFDAEQIWQQIDLQSHPLITTLTRHVTKLTKNQPLKKIFADGEDDVENNFDDMSEYDDVKESDDVAEFDDMGGDVASGDDDVEGESDGVEGGVEDKFFNVNEMKAFLRKDEAREYGFEDKKGKKGGGAKGGKKIGHDDESDEDEFDDGFGKEEEDDDEEDELGVFGLEGEGDDSGAEDIRYEDFFTNKKKVDQNKTSKSDKKEEVFDMIDEDDEEEDEDSETDDEDEDEDEDEEEEDEDEDAMESDDETKTENLSTHEKQLLEQRAKIEQVEKENLEAKSWTMRGEVSAPKRPVNSALEADLDWERNAKPPPVITEEFSQSIEELIMKRISEGQFDDVQRASSLPTKAPREMKELDENQSKKGLGEIYADEYAQKTGLVSEALTFSDEQKKEASVLFKKLCLKLDALSHFHFTPKPIIEDMSIQTNVPALAMEEIAPLAVSDAAMLAPEEVFSGKGDIKEEAELTQADRKRRRASKKRKFKAENTNKMAKKPRESTLTAGDGKEDS